MSVCSQENASSSLSSCALPPSWDLSVPILVYPEKGPREISKPSPGTLLRVHQDRLHNEMDRSSPGTLLRVLQQTDYTNTNKPSSGVHQETDHTIIQTICLYVVCVLSLGALCDVEEFVLYWNTHKINQPSLSWIPIDLIV